MANNPTGGKPVGKKIRRPRICVDLDGVLNLYTGWKGENVFASPRPGAVEFLKALAEKGYEVVVFTTRNHGWTWTWLSDHGLGDFVERVTNEKLPAMAYVDDRAVRFRGEFDQVLEDIKEPPFWHPDFVFKKHPLKEGWKE